MTRPAIFALCLSLAAPAALAQSLDIEGRVGLGLTDARGDSWIAPVDMTATWRLGAYAAVEIGTFAYGMPGKRPHETYAALHWGDLRLGVVRPAYDAVLISVFEETAPHRAYAEAETTRAHTTTRAMRVNAVPVGLSYDRQDGATWWGLSLHSDAKGAFSSATAAIRGQEGAWTVAAAVESVHAEGAIRNNTKLGLRWKGARIEAGLAAFHPDASSQPDALALDLHWQASDRLRLSALAETARGTAPDTGGLAATWALSPGLTLSGAALHEGDRDSAHLTLTRRF
ncbi:hypothetical protein [Thetidibacter halocola]|uniref:Uncharacterized protein n=1 Tax=Thetidibacter halocola TaxID=2827239 RepID=A0A8J7WJQ5_9RHOB|nr:hypothetical protein [Thetidibacter halocola]MBS0126578.1 hypothetical protein [Thetidibacter halocola]